MKDIPILSTDSIFHTLHKHTSLYLLLSQSGKGPNVKVVESDNKEKLYFGVEDPITASAGNFKLLLILRRISIRTQFSN